jgi:hypothetical protein
MYQQEDIRACVTFREGDAVRIENLVSKLKNYNGGELDPILYMRSWVTVLDSAAVRQCNIAGVNPYGTYIFAEFPDHPMYQPKNDLVAACAN